MTAVCKIFNLLHFRSTAAQRGGGGHNPNGPMVNTPQAVRWTVNS